MDNWVEDIIRTLPNSEANDYLRAVAQALPRMEWKVVVPLPAETDALKKYSTRILQGHEKDWRVIVTDFDIEDQGFPPNSRGYDGAAVGQNIVVHLPREFARRAFEIGLKRVVENL